MSQATAQLYFALVLIPCAIALFKDLSEMRIPNAVSLCLIAIFAVTAPFLMGWQEIAVQVGLALAVFVILFLFYLAGVMGAGDVKFAAAIMLFVQLPDATFFVRNLGLIALAGLIAHVTLKNIAAIRNLAPHWQSWREKGHFPYGMPLAASLLFYLWTRMI